MVNFLLSHESYLVNRFKLFCVVEKTFANKYSAQFTGTFTLFAQERLPRKHTITPTGLYRIHFRIISS